MTSRYQLVALILCQPVFFLLAVLFTAFIYLISTSPKSLSLATFITFFVTVKRLAGRMEGNVRKDAGGRHVKVIGMFKGKYV
jgi:hypothetical protein